MDCSPPGSSVHGISQARILEWVSIPFSRGSSHSRDWDPELQAESFHLSHQGSPIGFSVLTAVQQKYTSRSQQRKVHIRQSLEETGSQSHLPVESHRCTQFPAASCDNMCEMLEAGEACTEAPVF